MEATTHKEMFWSLSNTFVQRRLFSLLQVRLVGLEQSDLSFSYILILFFENSTELCSAELIRSNFTRKAIRTKKSCFSYIKQCLHSCCTLQRTRNFSKYMTRLRSGTFTSLALLSFSARSCPKCVLLAMKFYRTHSGIWKAFKLKSFFQWRRAHVCLLRFESKCFVSSVWVKMF